MKIQIVGPVCGTGYGLIVANLVHELRRLGEKVQLLSLGDMVLNMVNEEVAVSCGLAREEQTKAIDRPDVTLCIWHEWDHPPKELFRVSHWLSKNYIAMPTFELDRVKPEAIQALKGCRNVLVSSLWNKTVLERQGLTNVVQLVHHGVDTDLFKLGNVEAITEPKGPFRMFNLGKLELRKGHDLCVDLVAAMVQMNIDVQLWAMWDNQFMGTPSMRRLLAKWAQRAAKEFNVDVNEIYKRVLMIAPRPKAEDVAWTINATHVGVYPYRAEGWNLPLLETMACGRPVIATYATGPKTFMSSENSYQLVKGRTGEWADDGVWFGPGRQEGMWVEPDFEELLQAAVKLRDLWVSGKLEPNFAGRKTAMEYTWKAAALRLVNWLRPEFGS